MQEENGDRSGDTDSSENSCNQYNAQKGRIWLNKLTYVDMPTHIHVLTLNMQSRYFKRAEKPRIWLLAADL